MSVPSRGRFISFEGIDGAGKSSHIEALAAWLRARGHEVVVSREPGGTVLAERLRELVLHQAMDALTESLLVFAARRDHLVTHIMPALARGAMVLCDRFTDASFAYQGAGRGFDLQVLAELEQWVQGGLQPDLTLWFDIAPALAAERRGAQRVPDRFEAQDEAFFVRVSAGYAQRMAQQPQRFARLNAGADKVLVWAQIEAVMHSRPWW
jgi:dTMP kinase